MTSRRGFFFIGVIVGIAAAIALVALIVRMNMPPPTSVRAVTARALDEDYRPVEPTGMFAPEDTFYLSVLVENARPGSLIGVRWRYGEALITAEEQVLGQETGYTTGFQLSRADAPWPEGDYSAEVFLNGQSVGIARFAVTRE